MIFSYFVLTEESPCGQHASATRRIILHHPKQRIVSQRYMLSNS